MDDASLRANVAERLTALGNVDGQEMFGGLALYVEGFFIGIVYKAKLYLKTNDQTAREFRARGMGPFAPSDKVTLTNFHEVPAEVLNDEHALLDWAGKSIGTQNG